MSNSQNYAQKQMSRVKQLYYSPGFQRFMMFGLPLIIIFGSSGLVMGMNFYNNKKDMRSHFYYEQSLIHRKMEMGAAKYRCMYQSTDSN